MSLTSAIVDVVARSKIMDWLYIRNGLYKFSLSQRLNNVSTIKKTCNLKAQYVSDRASKLWLGCGSSSCCYLPITSIRPIWPTDCLGIRHIHAWTRRDFFSIGPTVSRKQWAKKIVHKFPSNSASSYCNECWTKCAKTIHFISPDACTHALSYNVTRDKTVTQ